MSTLVRGVVRHAIHVAWVVALLGCASSDDEALALDLISDAIDAVDDHFSADVNFYEINATSDGVNLFVSVPAPDGIPRVVQARYTTSRELVVAEEAVESQGTVFSGRDVDFDPATILDQAVDQLTSSQPLVFIMTAPSGEDVDSAVGVTYRVVMESRRGGRLVVLLDSDGSILGSDVME